MKLIIDIPEDVYTRLFDNGIQDNEISLDDICEMARSLRLGIPIPDNATDGEWVDQYDDGNWHCSKCGAIVEKDEQINHNWYFCYHCGTKMNEIYQKGGKE